MRRRDVSRLMLATMGVLAVSAALAGSVSAESGFATLPSRAELQRFLNLDGSCGWLSAELVCLHAGYRVGRIGSRASRPDTMEATIKRRNLPLRIVSGREGFVDLQLALRRGEWVAMTWQVGEFVGPRCSGCGTDHRNLHMLNVVAMSTDGTRWAILDNRDPLNLHIISREKAWSEYNDGGAWGIVLEAKR